MLTRIRYTQMVDEEVTVFVSKPMAVGDDMLTITLHPSNGQFFVTGTDDELVTQGTGHNLAFLKKNAKTALVALGANFLAEVRNSKKSVTAAPVVDESVISTMDHE